MIKIGHTFVVTDDVIAQDTGDKLFGQEGRIKRLACDALMRELIKSDLIRIEVEQNYPQSHTRVHVSILVEKPKERHEFNTRIRGFGDVLVNNSFVDENKPYRVLPSY